MYKQTDGRTMYYGRSLYDLAPKYVEKTIREACKYVRSVKLFDVYEGLPIPPTRKSMAFTVTFRPKEEELKNEDIDRYVEKILRTLGNRCGITMRE